MGSVQKAVICTLVTDGSATVSTGACVSIPRSEGIYRAAVVEAYVIDASQKSQFEAALGAFDYGYAGAIWGVAFTGVVGLYFVSHSISLVLSMIRRG